MSDPAPAATADELVRQARRLLDSGAWAEAARVLSTPVAEDSALAWEERGTAAIALFEIADAVAAWARAYTLYSAAEDVHGMVRMAILQGWGALAQRGDHAVCYGWLERSRELLRDQPESLEHGWLALREADLFHRPRHEVARGLELVTSALTIARRFGDCSLEMECLALHGVLLLRLGRFDEGMRQLDHAAMIAASGRARDPLSTATVLGHLLKSCEECEDFERSAQWFRLLDQLHAHQPMPLLEGLCRSHLARLRIERGQWAEARQSLNAPIECTHYVRQRIDMEWGVLALREGDLEAAEQHFTRTARLPESQLGLAVLALEGGDAQAARDLAERHLRGLPEAGVLERWTALGLLARAQAALGQFDEAATACDQVLRAARCTGTPGMFAFAHRVRGELDAARGEAEDARRAFEDAVDAASRAGLPFEEALGRLGLAKALRAVGRECAAQRESMAAAELFHALGSPRRAQQAESFTAAVACPPEEKAAAELPLSERELEVLRLVAAGLGNKEIAVRLYLSEHTVKRHVANILARLELSSRAAAVAYAARLGKI